MVSVKDIMSDLGYRKELKMRGYRLSKYEYRHRTYVEKEDTSFMQKVLEKIKKLFKNRKETSNG